jgi:biotin-dependent carboxylase-like uncharacterized protein
VSGAGLLVRKPGPLTLIQDLGRTGYFRQGLTVGGPADLTSFLWANRLCGNRADTPALEIVIGGMVVEATADCQIAISGGDSAVLINGRAVRSWSSHQLRAGDLVDVGVARRGTRLYLAVRGGFQVATLFDSAATVCREQLGGLGGNGEPLKAGDVLPVQSSTGEANFYLPPERRPDIFADRPLRMVPGWQYQDLPQALRKNLFSRTFTLSSQCDRMGFRLTGHPLGDCDTIADAMVSEGIIAGAVQIPPDGLPIVMMVDHQTIGGYAKAGTVLRGDLSRLAQMRPGDRVGFQPVSSLKARHISRALWRLYESTAPDRA